MTSSEKTVALLKLLGRVPYVHSVTELGEKIGCTKGGTYKLLAALVQSGLAAQTVDRKYTLGPVVYILGKTYEDHIGPVSYTHLDVYKRQPPDRGSRPPAILWFLSDRSERNSPRRAKSPKRCRNITDGPVRAPGPT